MMFYFSTYHCFMLLGGHMQDQAVLIIKLLTAVLADPGHLSGLLHVVLVCLDMRSAEGIW